MHKFFSVTSFVLWLFFVVLLTVGFTTDLIRPLPVDLVYEEACEATATDSSGCEKSLDVIMVAAQLGRLDMVSIGLALLGTSIAVLGLFAFFYIKEKAESVARSTAEEIKPELKEKLESSLLQELHEMLPQMVLDTESFIRDRDVKDEEADEIAASYSEERNE